MFEIRAEGHVGLHVKCPILFSAFNYNLNAWTHNNEILQNYTDMMKATCALWNLFTAHAPGIFQERDTLQFQLSVPMT